MRASDTELLACPGCLTAPLALSSLATEGDDVIEGRLECACGRTYPVEDGIARLLPEPLREECRPAVDPADEAARWKRSEMKARDEQAGAYDRMWHLALFGLVEVPMTLRYLELRADDRLIEAGCGTGRMTAAFAARCQRLVAVDYSMASLRSNASKLRQRNVHNVSLIQADICRMPFRASAFSRLVSCQVLEHVPTPESRRAAVGEFARVLAPGGRAAISAYQYNPVMRLMRSREGSHAGGIYFHRFRRPELRALLSEGLRVERMTGLLVYHYLARCAKEAA